MTVLARANGLSRADSGVFVGAGDPTFAYSDGRDSERYLEQVLHAATDLSSTSSELEACIAGWPSEYHLSTRRANLLRGLPFDAGLHALEIGCGCGAITRYLGEAGFNVDAVEGSAERAKLAAARCRDLSNVDIICADFKDLEVPHGAYGAVFLIGVAEYAGRYARRRTTDEQAVVDLLSAAGRAAADGGVVLVAIENRTGMKYVMGAHEDHHAKRYIGIHDYPENAGMRTYTRGEWRAIADAAGFKACRCLLPFPDYKMPVVLLSEDYATRSPRAYAHLEGVASRDYTMALDLGVHEPVFWEAASATGTLAEFANSFLIVLGQDEDVVRKIADFDFVHLPDFKRKPAYRVVARKTAASDSVERRRLADAADPNPGLVTQRVLDEPFYEGNLLSVDWSRSLMIDPWAVRFRRYLGEYFSYLQAGEPGIDLVPTNIVVDGSGKYRRFDQEWEVAWPLTPSYVFFRALMLFALRHKATLREFARRYGLYNVRDFILFGFASIKVDAAAELSTYIEAEERFQNLVNERDASGTVSDLLEVRIDQPALLTPVCAKVYWKAAGEPYSEQRSVSAEAVPDRETVRLEFELPAEVGGVTHIRFDPCDEKNMDDIGFLKIPYLRVVAEQNGGEVTLVELESSQAVAETGALSGIVFGQGRYGEIFAVVDKNPEIEFRLDAPAGERAPHGGGYRRYRVEAACTHVRSREYLLVRDRFLAEEQILKATVGRLESECRSLKQELDAIKGSKLWKLGQGYRSIRNRIGE